MNIAVVRVNFKVKYTKVTILMVNFIHMSTTIELVIRMVIVNILAIIMDKSAFKDRSAIKGKTITEDMSTIRGKVATKDMAITWGKAIALDKVGKFIIEDTFAIKDTFVIKDRQQELNAYEDAFTYLASLRQLSLGLWDFNIKAIQTTIIKVSKNYFMNALYI